MPAMGSDDLLREYLRVAPMSRALIRSRELELIIDHPPEGRLLDLGHGDGIFAQILARHGVEIFVGVDLSIEELRRARPRRGAKHFVVADMERLPFRDRVFGGAISNCVLEHVVNIDTALRESVRTLRPGARFLATVVTARYELLLFWPRLLGRIGLRPLSRMYLDKLRVGFRHERYPRPQEWIDMAVKAGFRLIESLPYVGVRRQMMLDLLLPFVVVHDLLHKRAGLDVSLASLVPVRRIHDHLASDRTEVTPGESANLMMILERP